MYYTEMLEIVIECLGYMFDEYNWKILTLRDLHWNIKKDETNTLPWFIYWEEVSSKATCFIKWSFIRETA